jgi:hypothetical protein
LDANGLLTIKGSGDMYSWLNWNGQEKNIKEVVIESGVTSIGARAFKSCLNLTTVTLPKSVTSIEAWAFEYCISLTSVTIPEGVTSIGDYAFYACTSLTSITIPASLTSIGEDAFGESIRLSDVYYGGDESAWEDITIHDYNSELTSATIHYNSAISSGTPGDINEDGKVDTNDLVRLMKKISENAQETYLDINGDGKVDTNDLIRLMKYLTDNTVKIY